MTKRPYLRALLIGSIQVLVASAVTVAEMLAFGDRIPFKVHMLVSALLLFAFTFLFGEWIFMDPPPNVRRVAGIILATFAWEWVISVLVWSSITGDNLFLAQNAPSFFMGFAIHCAAMAAAYYDRSRLPEGHGPWEGLAS